MDKKYLPLEFQKLEETVKSKETTSIKTKKTFVSSIFYNTNQHKPESYYRPISKMVTFEDGEKN